MGENVLQHIWDDEESDVATANVNLIQVAHSTVSRRHGDVLQLNVHVVLGCARNR